jgi:hypothetical protein
MKQRPILALLAVLLASCSADGGSQNGGGAEISRQDLGKDWPLTVDSGTLHCERAGLDAVTFTADDGTTYAVNGAARGTDEWPDIDQIWADNPDAKGLKIDIGPLIQRGSPYAADILVMGEGEESAYPILGYIVVFGVLMALDLGIVVSAVLRS